MNRVLFLVNKKDSSKLYFNHKQGIIFLTIIKYKTIKIKELIEVLQNIKILNIVSYNYIYSVIEFLKTNKLIETDVVRRSAGINISFHLEKLEYSLTKEFINNLKIIEKLLHKETSINGYKLKLNRLDDFIEITKEELTILKLIKNDKYRNHGSLFKHATKFNFMSLNIFNQVLKNLIVKNIITVRLDKGVYYAISDMIDENSIIEHRDLLKE